jgi:hypothetical protein
MVWRQSVAESCDSAWQKYLAAAIGRAEHMIGKLARSEGFRLAIWFFWLLASMAIGGMSGAWLSDDEFTIYFGIIVGGFTYTCFRIFTLRRW